MRLDQALTKRGLSRSRNQAARLIQQGSVTVNGVTQTKASLAVMESDVLETKEVLAVSRAGEKLAFALREFGVIPSGVCLDIGASTGGFTEVLLAQGADKVVAIDVGHDQLSPELKFDPRVVNLEGTNVRELTLSQLQKIAPERPSLVVVDLSFISLTKVTQRIVELAQGCPLVCLVKPQFELDRTQLRSGVVASPSMREHAVSEVIQSFSRFQYFDCSQRKSPISGLKGNTEYLVHFQAWAASSGKL